MNASHRNTSLSTRLHKAAGKPALAGLMLAMSTAFMAAPAAAEAPGQRANQGQPAAGDGEWVPGRLLVQPRPGLPEAAFEKILQRAGGRSVGRIEGINVHIVELPPQASERAAQALLNNNPHLNFAELDRIFKPDATNDPYYDNAWHLAKIGAASAWDISAGAGVTIAVLDTGVDGDHPDLAGQLLPGWNLYDNNADTSDVHGHGTRVAGTAAAETDNGIGVAAIARDAMIMPLRISSPTGGATLSRMAEGIRWAADNGARVANISYSGARGSATVQSAAQYMKDQGGLVVVSGGNSGEEEFIARSDTLIVSSATTSSDALASWSSYGEYIDVAAPGAGIWTTSQGGDYNSVSGTSFASPATGAVVAKMMAANPGLGPNDIQQLLYSSAVDLGDPGWNKYYGEGRIDADAAVRAAAAATSSDTTPPEVAITSPGEGSTVEGLVAVDVSASDDVSVSRVDLLVNGEFYASDNTAPYAFSWDSTSVADGEATLTATAFDEAGNSASDSVGVTVENATASEPTEPGTSEPGTSEPEVTIGNPEDGSTVNGNVHVEASANGGVSRMRLYINDDLVATANGDSLRYRWAARLAPSGNHTLRAEAEDGDGNLGEASVTVFKR